MLTFRVQYKLFCIKIQYKLDFPGFPFYFILLNISLSTTYNILHFHLPPACKASICGNFVGGDLYDDVHFVGVGVFATEISGFGGVVDENEGRAGVVLSYFLEGVQVEACFGDGVNEDEVEAFEGVGELSGDEEAGMGGVEALDLFLERVAEALFYGAVEDVAVMGGEMVGKAKAKGGFTGFGQAIDHSGKAHGGIAHEFLVFSAKADGLKVHGQEVLRCDYIGIRVNFRRCGFFFS